MPGEAHRIRYQRAAGGGGGAGAGADGGAVAASAPPVVCVHGFGANADQVRGPGRVWMARARAAKGRGSGTVVPVPSGGRHTTCSSRIKTPIKLTPLPPLFLATDPPHKRRPRKRKLYSSARPPAPCPAARPPTRSTCSATACRTSPTRAPRGARPTRSTTLPRGASSSATSSTRSSFSARTGSRRGPGVVSRAAPPPPPALKKQRRRGEEDKRRSWRPTRSAASPRSRRRSGGPTRSRACRCSTSPCAACTWTGSPPGSGRSWPPFKSCCATRPLARPFSLPWRGRRPSEIF